MATSFRSMRWNPATSGFLCYNPSTPVGSFFYGSRAEIMDRIWNGKELYLTADIDIGRTISGNTTSWLLTSHATTTDYEGGAEPVDRVCDGVGTQVMTNINGNHADFSLEINGTPQTPDPDYLRFRVTEVSDKVYDGDPTDDFKIGIGMLCQLKSNLGIILAEFRYTGASSSLPYHSTHSIDVDGQTISYDFFASTGASATWTVNKFDVAVALTTWTY